MVTNPILKGMNPDPSICSDGSNYYIATSTFEWFPGLKIYQSSDLSNWKLIARPLNNEQINLQGVPDSAGVWAPCLRYFDEKFWLTYSVMHSIDGNYKDLRDYLVTSDEIDGNWSKPIYIGSQGFDPSIFRDDDGEQYILSQNWDYRRTYTHQAFNGTIIQKYDKNEQHVTGEVKQIFKGSAQGGTEGPTLFKHNGFYYLLTAEGGSGRHHSITVARAKNIFGPYELSPKVHLLSSYNSEKQILQKAGHGNLINGIDGKTYLVHLVSRYLPNTSLSVLGRETAIEPIEWIDDWPQIVDSHIAPLLKIDALPENKQCNSYQTKFDSLLDLNWSSLRQQAPVTVTGEGLKIMGDESLSSRISQSLITRPWPEFTFHAETELSFDPKSFRNEAGIVLYYNTRNWLMMYESFDELTMRKILNLQVSRHGKITEPSNGFYIYLPEKGNIRLAFDINNAQVQASYLIDKDQTWKDFGRTMDASYLSDEGVDGWGFTGATVGLTCIDTNLKDSFAIFKDFKMTW